MSNDTDLQDLHALLSAASRPSTCPTADVLARGAAGELSAGDRRALADHLASCAACSEEYRVAASLAGWAQQTSEGLDVPRRDRRVLAIARWPLLAAAAAALVIVGTTVALVVWNLSLRTENARLAAAIDDSADTAAARAAELETRDQAQSAAMADLEARLADARGPIPNVPIVDLLPWDATRGGSSPTPARVPAGAQAVAFVITTPSDPSPQDHELEIVGASGLVVWRGGGLRPNAERTFTVTVPRSLLSAGTTRLRLYASTASGPRLVSDYVVRVAP